MTQCEKILAYLDKHGSISTMEGMSKLRIANFTARISDLRKAGVELTKETVIKKNKDGETIAYGVYRRANGQ